MNEKKLKKEIVEIFKKYKSVEDIGTRLIMLGFQKGKDEQKKEELIFLQDLIFQDSVTIIKEDVRDRIKQLQKEIGEYK